MAGLYIFGGLIVVGIVALIVFKMKSSRADRVVARGRAEKIEEERIEAVAKADARGKN